MTEAYLSVVFPYSRHDARDGNEFSYEVGQVAVQEDDQRLNLSHLSSKACGEGCHKAEEQAEKHATQTHHKKAKNAQENISGVHHMQLCYMVEKIIQYLEHKLVRHLPVAKII